MVGKIAAPAMGAAYAAMAPRREQEREYVAGAQHLDRPARGRDRATARRLVLHDLHEDRLGNFAVLPDPAGAGCYSVAAAATDGAVSYCRDLARGHAGRPRRLALHRRGGDGGLSERRLDLWRALRTRPRADAGLADAFPLPMGGGRRHHGNG